MKHGKFAFQFGMYNMFEYHILLWGCSSYSLTCVLQMHEIPTDMRYSCPQFLRAIFVLINLTKRLFVQLLIPSGLLRKVDYVYSLI